MLLYFNIKDICVIAVRANMCARSNLLQKEEKDEGPELIEILLATYSELDTWMIILLESIIPYIKYNQLQYVYSFTENRIFGIIDGEMIVTI